MISIESIKALDIYDLVVASYATQQSLIRSATQQSILIRPRLLTPPPMLELLTFALPSKWEGMVYQHLGLEPGFSSVVAELLRSPESNHHHLPKSLQEFYAMLLAEGLVNRQQMISPSLSIGILGPVSQSLLVHLTSYSVEHIDWSMMESTIEYTNFDTQYEEVVHVFEEIAKQVEHQPLDSIAILAPETNYKPLIDTIAARFDLPVQWQDGTPLVHHPVIFELLETLKTHPWSLGGFIDYRQPLVPQFERLNLKPDEQRHIQRFAECSLMSDIQGATMYHEYRFFQMSDEGPINCIIDLLIVGPDICRIVDFKLKSIDQP